MKKSFGFSSFYKTYGTGKKEGLCQDNNIIAEVFPSSPLWLNGRLWPNVSIRNEVSIWTISYVIKDRFHFFSNKSLLDQTGPFKLFSHPVSCRAILTLRHFKTTFNPLSANLTKWSDTLKQFVAKLPTNCLSMFDHFMGLALKGLRWECLIEFFVSF